MHNFIFTFILLNISFCYLQNFVSALPETSKNKQVLISELENDNVDLLNRVKRRVEGRYWTTRQIFEAILCVFLPPVAVLIHGGPNMLLHLILNIVLWICGWVPGAIHAFWYCFYRD